ncbi:MAG: GNAT family N-acetyltransferase [Clostridiales bacterium]|nr:GNAT family N-acetyltransferase [Clostridiales bacterium]
MYLRKDKRGKGYGKKALMFIEEFVRQRDYKRLQFKSEMSNPNAMNF